MDHSARSVQIQRRSEFWRPKKNVTQPAALIVPTRPPTRTTRPTATPGKYVFLGNIPKNPNPAPVPDPLPVDPNLLTGVAAVTAAASATATALFMRRKREEELRRIADESCAEAEARARAANQAKIQAHLEYLAKTKSEKLQKEGKSSDCRKKHRPIQNLYTASVGEQTFSKRIANLKNLTVGSNAAHFVTNERGGYAKRLQAQSSEKIKPPSIYINYSSQYIDNIRKNYGFMGCGAVSVCEGLAKIAINNSLSLDIQTCTDNFLIHLKDNGFSIISGIQPEGLFLATKAFLNEENATTRVFNNVLTLSVTQNYIDNPSEALKILHKNSISNNESIILDFTAVEANTTKTLVNHDNNSFDFVTINSFGTKITSEFTTDQTMFSHFALFRGIDAKNNNYLFSETLTNTEGYDNVMATVSEKELLLAWHNPEFRAQQSSNNYNILNLSIEQFNYWMLQITGVPK